MEDELYQVLNEKDTLVQFPCIFSIEVNGYLPKLIKWLKETPTVEHLHLKSAGVQKLDLRDTGLDYLAVNITDVKELVLPEELTALKLYGNMSKEFRVDAGACKYELNLLLSLQNSNKILFEFIGGVVNQIYLFDVVELDIELLVKCFPKIECLVMHGAPGTIINIGALKQLQGLQKISCMELFGYDDVDLQVLEELPELRELDFDSMPKSAGAYLKKHWKGKLDELSVTHLRDEEWLKENLMNPLRHWDGSDFVPPAAYKSALKCYKNTKKQLQNATGREQIEAIVLEYTKHFNKLNQKYHEFIETDEREDIFMVMEELYQEFVEDKKMITLKEIQELMDRVRDAW